MATDTIVGDIRCVREDEAAKHDFDVKAIIAASRKRQRRSRRKVVSFIHKNEKLSTASDAESLGAQTPRPAAGR